MNLGDQNINDDLILRCLNGDRIAQLKLYDQYSSAIYTTCLRLTKHSYDAEQLMQDTFLNAFSKLDQYRGDASLGAWIKRIAIRNCLDHLRKSSEIMLSYQEGYIEENTEEELEPVFDMNTILKAIDELATGYRVALTLYLLEGYDHTEIAQILGITPSASRSQVARAKQKLQLLLKPIV